MARCYSQLGEPEMQQDAYLRAIRANPQDIAAKQALIAQMVAQGDIEGAIKEYRAIIVRAPQAAPPLGTALDQRNRQRPASSAIGARSRA